MTHSPKIQIAETMREIMLIANRLPIPICVDENGKQIDLEATNKWFNKACVVYSFIKAGFDL